MVVLRDVTDHIRSARGAIQKASEAARANIREQLLQVDQGLRELEAGDSTQSDVSPKRERLEQIEEKLVGMADRADDTTVERHLEVARDHLDQYRQARGIPEEERD